MVGHYDIVDGVLVWIPAKPKGDGEAKEPKPKVPAKS